MTRGSGAVKLGKSGADERRSTRSKVLLTAAVECDGIRIPVRVINLSAHGVLIAGDAMPPQDRPVVFRCSGSETKGWMAWIHPPHAGINFDEPIKPQDVLPKTQSAANTVTKDTREIDFRRPGFRGNQMSPEEWAIVEKWQREQLEKDADKTSMGETSQSGDRGVF